jgi:integrase
VQRRQRDAGRVGVGLDTAVKPEPRRRLARLVFTDAAGLPIRRTRFSTIWRPAAAVAELGDGVTFHDLRLYYASLLIPPRRVGEGGAAEARA